MLFAAQRVVEDRNVVVLDDNNAAASPGDESSFTASEDDGSATDQPPQPVETFPPAEPAARNFLITGCPLSPASAADVLHCLVLCVRRIYTTYNFHHVRRVLAIICSLLYLFTADPSPCPS